MNKWSNDPFCQLSKDSNKVPSSFPDEEPKIRSENFAAQMIKKS